MNADCSAVADMPKEQLLGEVELLLQTMPTREEFSRSKSDCIPWLGRAQAVIQRWNGSYETTAQAAGDRLRSVDLETTVAGFGAINTLLLQARADLQTEVDTSSVIVQQGQVFGYFDQLRKVIEPARTEVFFVDPYLNPDFVSRYLPHVRKGVAVRLLGWKGMPALFSAVDVFAQESGLAIEVRSSNGLHDRFLFVDGNACYLSGASFKDGAKYAPATLTRITDAFRAMWDTYEGLWTAGKRERS
jgi:hypothetical protein